MSSSKYIKKVAVIFELSTTSLRQLFNNPQRNEWYFAFRAYTFFSAIFCTRDTPCEMMTISDVIDWVTWLLCNVEIRNGFLMRSSKIENGVFN